MTDPILYTNPMSRGRIARWMLEEVGADYEVRLVDFGDKDAEFVEANPMAKVPTIVHGERVVTEAAAICAYLADVYPQARLAPPVDERGDYYRWMFFAAGPLEQAVTSNALGWTPNVQQQGMVGFGSYDRVLDTLEGAVSDLGDGWLTGADFTAADLYVGAHLSFGTGFGSIPKREPFVRFVQRVNARPAALRANALDDAWMGELKAGAPA